MLISSSPPATPPLSFLGRSVLSGGKRSFDWTGGQIRLSVTNTKFVDVVLTSPAGFTWVVDAKADGPIFLGGRTRVAKDLSSGTHTVILWKRNEPSVPKSGVSVLSGIYISDGAKLNTFPAASRRLEYAGASMTGGYGDLGPAGCSGNGPNGTWQNSYRAYGGVISRKFHVDSQWVSQSGWGVVKGAGAFSTIYDLAVKEQSEKWNFKSWIPHGVVINLNTNDARANPPPSATEFTNAYKKLISHMQSNYGSQVQIFSICGPMIQGTFCDLIKNISTTPTTHYLNVPKLPAGQTGCDGHPNQAGHETIAGLLEPLITKALGWS